MVFKNIQNYSLAFILGAIFLVVIVGEAYALRVIPQRLVLDPDVKIEYMFIKNNSNNTESYRFGWKHMAMDKEGNVLNLDKIGMENAPSEYKAADDLIRFSPRRATLKPGETQRITFMVKRSDSVPVGEYRSHFLFQREPNVEEPETTDQGNADNIRDPEDARPKVAFDVLVSRAVPIYVLHGETQAKIEFVSAEVKKNINKKDPKQPDYLTHFRVRKEGNRSVIGIAQVLCNSSGEEVIISKPPKVFAVYAEGEFRNENVAVKIPPSGCDSYRLIVKGHSDDVLAGQILIDQVF